MNRKNILKFFFAMTFIVTITSTVVYISMQYEEFQLKARSKEGLTLLNSAYVAMKATSAETNFFPSTLEESGFDPIGRTNYRIYASEDKLESRIRSIIPKDYLPFAQRDNFRLVAAAELSQDVFHLCKVDANKALACLWIKIENNN